MTKPVCLVVIDGWGVSNPVEVNGDAIENANTPVMDNLKEKYPYAKLYAHGLSVGLPDGLMGNSEVGHLNIGAGRVVYQDIVRIDLSIKNGSFKTNEALINAFNRAKATNGRLHVLGLVSDGGVHSHINHLFALIQAAKAQSVKDLFVHFFADGRDTLPTSAITYLEQLQTFLSKEKYGKVASVIGRYYAMDRDKRMERVAIAYEALVQGKGDFDPNIKERILSRYGANENDEFLKPIISDKEGSIRDKDTLIFFNYRSDRMRQIVQAFYDKPGFETAVIPKDLHIISMTTYSSDFKFPVISLPQSLDNVLAEWLSKNNKKQCHIAETEKYAHVTFFFNGGRELQFPLEERKLISSPKVATYDLKPEMSAHEVASAVIESVESKGFPFVMCNLAPPDMVGHTGNYEATIKAVQVTDHEIGRIYEACKKNDYVLLITADHGNAEKMLDDKGGPLTSHTTAQVPFIVASNDYKFKNEEGALCDVAPTLLKILGLPQPPEMTGSCLLE